MLIRKARYTATPCGRLARCKEGEATLLLRRSSRLHSCCILMHSDSNPAKCLLQQARLLLLNGMRMNGRKRGMGGTRARDDRCLFHREAAWMRFRRVMYSSGSFTPAQWSWHEPKAL